MAPSRKSSTAPIDIVFRRKFGNQVRRNNPHYLFENGKFILGWLHSDTPVKVFGRTLTCHAASHLVNFSENLWDGSVIVSYHYAARKAGEIRSIIWDRVILDEAHKLRNSHKENSFLGQSLRFALEGRKKILLTATPLQNSLSELYGLASFVDEQLFGDYPTFRTLFCGVDGDLADLKARLGTFAIRTLRRDVVEFIRYTQRNLVTIKFRPADEEQRLYEAISAFLQRSDTYSIPPRQRHLLTIVVRKVLASSANALAGTLDVILDRLRRLKENVNETVDITDRILSEEEIDEELLELLLEEIDTPPEENKSDDEKIELQKLEAEIAEVEQFARWARSIGIDTKTRNLLKALSIGWNRLQALGAEQKAVVFTESCRTQEYLRSFLEANGYAGQVICFSGRGGNPEIDEIYKCWKAANPDKSTGSKAADIRHAIVDAFRTKAKILIATEAAAEGFNLQFCSLLVNFDLPWNPQRIEQRIGRIHRYGQKHDVVVINFLNERNSADARVYDLLQHKFQLFEGIFGASDGILGQVESGAGLERKILNIYQNCRTEEEINAAFDALRRELDEQIQDKLRDTREKILGNFDEDVQTRLRVQHSESVKSLDRVGRKFWRLTKFVLKDNAHFDEKTLSFDLKIPPHTDIAAGMYSLIRKRERSDEASEEMHRIYHLSHPLGEWCIQTAKDTALDSAEIRFNLSGYSTKLSALEPLKGCSGWIVLNLLRIESEENEEHLLFTGITDKGHNIDPEMIDQMFRLDGEAMPSNRLPKSIALRLADDAKVFAEATIRSSMEQKSRIFQERREQLFHWADDIVSAAERDLTNIKAELRAAERGAGTATTIEEQHAAQNRIAQLETKKRQARRRIDDVEDEVFAKRNQLIAELERRISQKSSVENLFTIRWTVQ